MDVALRLAQTGEYTVSPNPVVGAVVVKEGRMIGCGAHQKTGAPHAEVLALEACTEPPDGATLYVTLEPCNHTGRTGPCTERILSANIGRVVIAMEDPNPLVAGAGIKRLQNAGIAVTEGVCKKKALRLNERFVHYITTQTPFVTLKCATTWDGWMATGSGDSKWISNEQSRQITHTLRHASDTILIGKNTAMADDPLLTVRLENVEKQPVRIVLDTNLTLPLESQLVGTAKEAPLWIVSGKKRPDNDFLNRKAALEKKGVRVITDVPTMAESDKIDFSSLIRFLGKEEISSLLIEGGGQTAHAALWAGVVQKIVWFLSPQLLGGSDGVSAFQGRGASRISECVKLYHTNLFPVEGDWMMTAYTTPQAWEE